MCWLWICRFLLISTGIIYGYYAIILKVDEEDFGGHGALLQEGLFASISLFLVLWSLSLSLSLTHTHTHTNRYMKLLWIYLWKGEGVCAVPDGLLLFFSCRGFLYTAWDTSDWLGANDSATIFFVISDVWTVLVTLHTMACALRTTRKFLTLICLLFLFFV